MKIGYIYIRVSTKKQVTEGYSLQIQEQECMKLLVSKGYTHVNTFSDKGISGLKIFQPKGP